MKDFLQICLDALSLGGLYALIALGVTLVYTVMGMMNFAHGELIMLAGYAMYAVSGSPFAVSVLAAISAAVLVALLLERIAFRPVRSADVSAQLVTSLAVSVVLQNVVIATVGSRPRSVDTPQFLSEASQIGGIAIPHLQLIEFALTGAALLGLALFLGRTRLGVEMRAAAEDFDMARLLGVRANAVIASAFAISGLLAGLVALVLVVQTGTLTPTMGLTPVLVGFVAVVIGGFGRISGAVVGGAVLGVLTTLLAAYLPPDLQPYRDALVFAAPVVILLVRPNGLLGSFAAPPRV